MGKPRKQPWQRNFEPDASIVNIDKTRCLLAQRRSPKGQAVTGPYLFVQRQQPSEFGFRAAEPIFYSAQGFILAEAMWNNDDKRL